MSVAKRLGLIALGYALAVAGGFAAVAVNEFFMPDDVAQGSPGMVAFGDMILLVLATGFFSLLPTWFLLKLAIEKSPRALLAALLLAAVAGPLSWLAVIYLAGGPPPDPPSRLPVARLAPCLRRHTAHRRGAGAFGDRGVNYLSRPAVRGAHAVGRGDDDGHHP